VKYFGMSARTSAKRNVSQNLPVRTKLLCQKNIIPANKNMKRYLGNVMQSVLIHVWMKIINQHLYLNIFKVVIIETEAITSIHAKTLPISKTHILRKINTKKLTGRKTGMSVWSLLMKI